MKLARLREIRNIGDTDGVAGGDNSVLRLSAGNSEDREYRENGRRTHRD